MTLYIKYRPTDFSDFVGNTATIESLKSILSRPINGIPHVLLFEGDYGTGKTTLAKIFANKLGCVKTEVHLIDAGTNRRVEAADKIKEHMLYRPLAGDLKAYIIDEIQTTSGSKFQESLLYTLEGGCPSYVYFILCTTNSRKINKGILNRSVIFHLNNYTVRELIKIQEVIVDKELSINFSGKAEYRSILRKIALKAAGSPRKALTILDKIISIIDSATIDELVSRIEIDIEVDGIDIVKCILRGNGWKYVADKIKNTKNTPEEIARAIINYCTGILLKCSDPKKEAAYEILATFIGEEIDRNKLIYLLACLF